MEVRSVLEQPACPVTVDVEAQIALWSRLTMAAHTAFRASNGAEVSPEFLYRRALALALRGVADWLHLAPERAFGLAVVSYQNMADFYAHRRNDEGRHQALREAYDMVAAHVLFVGTARPVRVVAVEYLDIVLRELAQLYDRSDRLDELEELLKDHADAVSWAEARP